MNIQTADQADTLLTALGEQLQLLGARYELVVVGGSALLALGLISRPHASRVDQIHLKLYATVDQGPGRHEADLRALQPTGDELVAAARWSRTHDPSEGYRATLERVLAALGVDGEALGT